MSPIIIGALGFCAIAMIFMAYMSKNKERNARIKSRRIAKFKERARKLDNIIFGLPSNYMPSTLRALVHASITDSLKQMYQLSDQSNSSAQLQRVQQTLSNLAKIIPPESAENHQHIGGVELKECKYLLKDLYSLIIEFHSEGSISRESAQDHLKIVRELMLRVTLDTYKDAASQASSDNNLGLALHYYSMAKSRLDQNPSLIGLESERSYFADKVDSLETQLHRKHHESSPLEAPEASVLAQWQAMEDQEDAWKKRRY